MPLYWIVHDHDGDLRVYLQDAGFLDAARIKASLAGHDGKFVEAHALDAKTAKKVPKKMIGRVLSQEEATELLGRLG